MKQSMTRVLRIEPGSDRSAIIEEAARALAAGGLCVFPTETVYGLGANGEIPEAVARLDKVKRRAAGKPYTLMLADKEELGRYVSKVPLIARKVIERFWPGPLTIVFADEGDEGLGVRVPDSETAREIVRAAKVPAVVTSANVSGEEPPTTAREAMGALDGLVEIVVDEGETRLRAPSTVLRLHRGRWDILREGVISEDMIAKHARATLLFVCGGNSCCGPLAEVICKTLIAEKLGCPEDGLPGLGYAVLSAGVPAAPVEPVSEKARIVAGEIGCSLDDHTPRTLTPPLVSQADMIYTMAQGQLLVVNAMGGEGKAALLGPEEIADPAGGDLDDFRECAVKIKDYLVEVLERIL